MASTTTSEYIVRMKADISDFRTNMNSAMSQMQKVETQANSLKTSAGSLGSGLKSLGKIAAGAVTVGALMKFGNEALNTASKLNAMKAMSNKAFGGMAGDIQTWAKSANTAYGLSQRMALQYTSTLGSMATGFGFTQSQAVDLSKEIAGRIGDLASYYSITQDEAYSKMTAIFSGETEALKSLGIVMTQTALDQFALANGFGKTTKQMTEQEKVMLRYKFLMDQTKLAEGDFVSSSQRGSWGNQIRQLKLQIEDFKAAVGQGLIVILTPALKVLNMFLSRMVTVANAFADLMAKLTGSQKKSVTSVVPAVADLSSNLGEVGQEATKATEKVSKEAKKATRSVMSFDELHTLSPKDESGSDDTAADVPDMGAVTGDKIETSMKNAETATKNETGALDGVLKKAKELAGIFSKGFASGWKSNSLPQLQENVERIKKAVKDIVTDPQVTNAADTWSKKWSYSMGQTVGSVASIGTTIGTLITGGIATYLEQNSERIKKYLVDMFDISGSIAEIRGQFSEALAEILSVFASENAQQTLANFIGIFADAFMGITELIMKLKLDLETLLMKPIIDNVDKIKETLDGLITFWGSIFGSIKDVVDNTVDKALQVYDEHIHPLFKSLTEGISEILGIFLDAWNTHIQPVLEKLSEKFDKLMKDHLQPMIDTGLEVIGELADTVKEFWENILKPAIEWAIKTIMPILGPIIEAIGSVIMDVAGSAMDGVTTVLKGVKGILEFLQKVFKGDWEAVWKDIKILVEAVWITIMKFIIEKVRKIKHEVSEKWEALKKVTENIFNGVKTTVKGVWDKIKGFITGAIDKAKEGVEKAVNKIKEFINFDGIVSKIQNAFSGVKDAICSPFESAWNFIKPIIDTITSFKLPSWAGGDSTISYSSGGSSVIDVGGFATGGFPEDGLFMANHNELVGKFSNGRTAVVNNSQIIDGVTRGVRQGVMDAMSRYNNNRNNSGGEDIVLFVGEEELARANMRGQKKLNKRYSPSIAFS